MRGRPGGLLQVSIGEAVKIFLASVSSDIRAMWSTGRNAKDVVAWLSSLMVVLFDS